jgi:hypothetical protein
MSRGVGTCGPRRRRQRPWRSALSLSKSFHYHHHAARLFQCRGGGGEDGEDDALDHDEEEETNVDLKTVHEAKKEEEGPVLEQESNATSCTDKEETIQESDLKSTSVEVDPTISTTNGLEPLRPASLGHSPLLRTCTAAAAVAITLAIAKIPLLNKFLLQSEPFFHVLLLAYMFVAVERMLFYLASVCAKL